MNHADADFVVAIKAAKTSEDVLRAVAKRANPNKPPPTPEDLAAWWHECSDVARTEANKRLRLLARAMEPDAPDDVIDACAFGPAKPGEMPGDESAGLLGRLPVRVRPLRSMFVVDRVSVSATVTYKGGNRAEPGARDEPEPATNRSPRREPEPEPATPERIAIATFGPLELSRAWLDMRDPDDCPKHPLVPIVRAWIERPTEARNARLIVTRERKPPPGSDPLTLTRQPGLLSLATLAVVEVDGEPLVSPSPIFELDAMRKARIVGAGQQEELFPGPKTLAGEATGGSLIEAVAGLGLVGDERNPGRGDVLTLGVLAYALSRKVRLAPEEATRLITGTATEAGIRRADAALGCLRSMSFQWKPGRNIDLIGAERGAALYTLGPPDWWLRAMQSEQAGSRRGRREPTGAPVAYRLSGTLFRPAGEDGGRERRGYATGYWGAVRRTVAGIEAALSWGPSAGAGKGGSLPDNLRAVRAGGPGPEVFIPWWQVLRLSGEPVGPDADPREAYGRRWQRRADMLKTTGYFVPDRGESEAGDTIEVVRQVRGSRAHTAGLIVRASARFIAAYSGDRTRIPAGDLLGP